MAAPAAFPTNPASLLFVFALQGWPTGLHVAEGLETAPWNDAVMDALEGMDFQVVADEANDCCFWACRTALAVTHRITGSTWRKSTPGGLTRQAFLRKVGASEASRDVHWPLTLTFRPRDSTSGYRKRSQAAIERRRATKEARGFGFGRPSGWSSETHGRPSGWSSGARSSTWTGESDAESAGWRSQWWSSGGGRPSGWSSEARSSTWTGESDAETAGQWWWSGSGRPSGWSWHEESAPGS